MWRSRRSGAAAARRPAPLAAGRVRWPAVHAAPAAYRRRLPHRRPGRTPRPGSPNGTLSSGPLKHIGVRYLILSDIHANIDALDAVLAAAHGRWDRVVVLGDLVGYGGEPTPSIDRVRALNPLATIRGNHDKAACGIETAAISIRSPVRGAVDRRNADPRDREYLRELPQGPADARRPRRDLPRFAVRRGSLHLRRQDAPRALDTRRAPVCLFGHTHLPVMFQTDGPSVGGFRAGGRERLPLSLSDGIRYAVNPGSVGQPRDGDPRAAFVIYDAGARLTLEPSGGSHYAIDAAQRAHLVGRASPRASRTGLA